MQKLKQKYERVLSWLSVSLKRVVLAGLLAGGLLASIGTFASGSGTTANRDLIQVTEPAQVMVAGDFNVVARVKPKSGRTDWSVRLFLDGRQVASYGYHGPAVDGQKV